MVCAATVLGGDVRIQAATEAETEAVEEAVTGHGREACTTMAARTRAETGAADEGGAGAEVAGAAAD